MAVAMPKMGISVSEGTIVEWRKEPGDWIEADATIAEIDTDARAGVPHPREEEAPEADADDECDRSGFYSPVVRRIAEKHGIELGGVHGTGIGGRVRKRDVLEQVRATSSASRPGLPGAEPKVLHTESPYRPDEPDAANGDRREPMTVMRKAIARHMVDSRHTAAHCTTIVEVDMSRVASRRAELKESMARKGIPLTYLAFVAVATVEALDRHPVLNASVEEDELVFHDDVNLGIAVALDQGLLVPVIRRAQRLSLEGMAAAIADVAARAREGQLQPDDVHGGTFTITNPGQFGAVLATPIINQPQVAILDLEAIVRRPVVIDDDAIGIRPMTYLPMSWDHRALDGAEAARFLSLVRSRLEGWEAG